MTPWRARLHSFQGINQRKVLHSCHAFELLVVAVAFVCAWRLHAEFVSFDYAVPLVLRDSTAKKRFDAVEAARSVSVAGVSLVDAELRNSVLTSQATKRLGSQLSLDLLYVSKTNNIFTDANLAAIKALEDKIRDHAEYPRFCARDWTHQQLLDASKITTDHPTRDAMNANPPPCKSMLTALQSCADRPSTASTCDSGRVTSLPAGLLDCKKPPGAPACAFAEMSLDMSYVNDRLTAYSKHDPGPNASAAVTGFYSYPSDNFGSAVSESASLRSTFTFALPLTGYLHSQDRPQEQEDLLWKFVYRSYHAEVTGANRDDLLVYYSCAARDACARLHLVKNTYVDGLLLALGVAVLLVFVAARQGSWTIGVNALLHLAAVFAGAYMLFAVWQQRTFGLFSVVSVFVTVMAVMTDTALAADLWRGTAAAGAGVWTAYQKDADEAWASRHQQRTVVCTRLLPLMGAGATVSFGAALACLASDFPAVRAFGIFSAAVAVVNFACSAVTLPAVLAVAYQDYGYFPFCGCLGGVTMVRPPSPSVSDNRVAPSGGGSEDGDMTVMVVPALNELAAPALAPTPATMSAHLDAVVAFDDQLPPVDPIDADDPHNLRAAFDEVRRTLPIVRAFSAEAAEAEAEGGRAFSAAAEDAEVESQRMDVAVARAEAEVAAMAVENNSREFSELQTAVDMADDEQQATVAAVQRRQDATALQTRLESEMQAARASTETAARDLAAARVIAEVMAATAAAGASLPPASASPPPTAAAVPPIAGNAFLRASNAAKRPGRPGRKTSPPGGADAGADADAGPVTESTLPPPDVHMQFHSPHKPGKPPASEASSMLMQAMARMHKAQADVILATGGGDGDHPATFGAVYAALLDRFKWGGLIFIAVCMGVLLATAVSLDADTQPPHVLPSGDNFREVHGVRAGFYSRGGSGDNHMRTRLVWGINPNDPVSRRSYPRETNPTQLGDVGDAVFANATRMSVGARCFLHLCNAAEIKDSPRATGGVSAGFRADCWMRDFKAFVDAAVAANITDQCGRTAPAWKLMTGCPSVCDCTGGYGISNGDGAGTDRACRLATEAQEKRWWESVYAFLRDVPGNFDMYAPKILGQELGHGDHTRLAEVLREVRQCPSDATAAMRWRYTFADVPLTAVVSVPAATGLRMERAWEAWWSERYAAAAGGADASECRMVAGMWSGFVYTPQTPGWHWEGTSPGDWFNAMDAVMLDVTKVVLVAHIVVAALVTLTTRSLPLGLIAAAATAVAETWMVSFVVLRGAKLGALEAIVLCITPAAVAPSLAHAAVAYAACDLPARGARVRAMLLEAGAAPLTAAVATMCATGPPWWGRTDPVKETAVYMFVLAFGGIVASTVFAAIVAAARPGHGMLGNCVKGEMDESVPGGQPVGSGAEAGTLTAELQTETVPTASDYGNDNGAGATEAPHFLALSAPDGGDAAEDHDTVKPFSPES